MKINILSGPHEGNSYNFEYDIIIGRDTSVDLPLPLDLAISRKHLKISIVNPKVLIVEDLNSTNGTFLVNKTSDKIQLIRLQGRREFSNFPLLFKIGNTLIEIENP